MHRIANLAWLLCGVGLACGEAGSEEDLSQTSRLLSSGYAGHSRARPAHAAFGRWTRPSGFSTPGASSSGSRNLHLESSVRFSPLQPGADAELGRELFGLAADLQTSDDRGALFEGFSRVARAEIVSNGRTCFSCHRGLETELGLPDLPLSDHVAADDPLLSGISADSGDDPRAATLLDRLGLVKYAINRFNPQRDADDPFRRVFGWRKTPNLLNSGLSQGFLTDGRGRVLFEAARGAVFSHTQSENERFDDLFPDSAGDHLEAFLFSLFTDRRLAALRDPDHPEHQTLIDDPFATVDLSTPRRRRGAGVFARECMSCHSTPNVFNNLDNVEPLGTGERVPRFAAFAPSVGRTFNIGVSERNVHDLDFRHHLSGGDFEIIELPLVDARGKVHDFEVDRDVGLAATTARLEDVGRFKVPHLRGLAENGPYFHDNSASTIEQALDHHLGPWYQSSPDGRRHPLHVTSSERRALLAFLDAL